MTYSIKQLPDRRWGIYLRNKLLATHGCQYTSSIVIELLQKKTKIN